MTQPPLVRNVLFATDFSDASRLAGESAVAFARHFGARLHVLHVVPPVTDPTPAPAALRAAAAEIERGLTVVTAIASGRVVRHIVDYARPREPAIDQASESGLGGLGKVVAGLDDRLVEGDQARQIYGGRGDDDIGARPGQREPQGFELVRAVAHGRDHRADMGVLDEHIAKERRGRGSMTIAPAAVAATKPAPCGIEPCVMVGPSSTTTTRRPRTAAASSSRTGDAARTIRALGLTARAVATARATWSGVAASTLFTTTRSAVWSTASPGW
jgi:Universal stress protein family